MHDVLHLPPKGEDGTQPSGMQSRSSNSIQQSVEAVRSGVQLSEPWVLKLTLWLAPAAASSLWFHLHLVLLSSVGSSCISTIPADSAAATSL